MGRAHRPPCGCGPRRWWPRSTRSAPRTESPAPTTTGPIGEGWPPSPEPALPGWRAALVPVAVPLTLRPALILLAVSADADRGAGVVAAALAVAVAALALTAAPSDGVGGRVQLWAARVTAAALVATSVLLLVDGVLAV